MIVCFGEMLLRLSPPGCERLFQSPVLGVVFGGSEANVATSLARFGVDVSFVTRLPRNALGDAALRTLRAEGVRTGHVARVDGRLGIYFVETGAGQRPSAVVYDRTPSTMSGIAETTFDWPRVLEGATWLHVSGITAALGPGPAACTLAAMECAKRAGITVSFDVNYRSSLWTADAAAPVVQRLAKHADLLIASQDHCQPLLGIAETRDAAAHVAARCGSRWVAMTLRDSHSASDNTFSALLWDNQTGDLHAAASHKVRIVDRVGSGDAFAAGLIYGMTSGRSAREAVQFAAAAGALKHTIPGDMNRVSVEEIDRLVAGDGSGRVLR